MTPTTVRILVLLLLAVPGVASTAATVRPPNILLIYSDDHGWSDLGAQGVDRDIRTPNLDQLARDGVRFARGYVSAPQAEPREEHNLTPGPAQAGRLATLRARCDQLRDLAK